MESFINGIVGWQGLILLVCAFWLPTVVAFSRGKESPWQVALVNLFFGVTGIGWVIAMIMAFGHRRPVAA